MFLALPEAGPAHPHAILPGLRGVGLLGVPALPARIQYIVEAVRGSEGDQRFLQLVLHERVRARHLGTTHLVPEERA